MSGRYGLIIANSEYTDPGLAQLTAPGKDAKEFWRVLNSPDIGAFDDVMLVLNQDSAAVNERIEHFFSEKKPDDLLLLYFSGHGVRDENGVLYLAVRNTNRNRLRSTGVSSSFVREVMDQSRSKRQLLILDCCNSGAFAQGTKAATGVSIGTASAFGAGYGHIVLTASDATQYAWEGDKVIGGETENSLFTHFLVKGLEGEADRDGDGQITVDELYDYVYEKVKLATPKQTPSKFSTKQQGDILLRQSIRIEDIKPVELPDDIKDEIKDMRPYVREEGVRKLEKLLMGRNLGLVRSAKEALEKIVTDENTTSRVAKLAKQALESIQQSGESEKQKEDNEDKQIADQKLEVQRLWNERAIEAERQEKEKAERFAAQKAEVDRNAKAEAERKARGETEQLRLATQQVEEERIAKAKLEAERLTVQKSEEERLAKAPAEADHKAKEEAKRIAIQKNEEERKAKVKAPAVQALPIEIKAETISATPQKKSIFTGRVIGVVAAFTVVVCVISGLGINSMLNNTTPTATEAALVSNPATEPPVIEAQAATEVPVSESIDVTLWYSYSSGSAEEATLFMILEQAAIDLPGIEISALQISFDRIDDSYRSEVAAGGGPDIILNGPVFIRDYARDGLVADITGLAAGRLDGYSQLGIDGMSLDGRLYGIPESLVGVGLWYDRSQLPTPPANTDELMAMISEGVPIGLGYDCYSVYAFYNAFGGTIFDADWNVIADQTGVVDTFYYLNDLYQISKSNGIPVNNNFETSLLTNGQFSAVMNGSWALSIYRDALGDNLAVASLPSGPGGPAAPLVDVNGFFINPNSPNQEVGLEVALYLTNAYSQTTMMEQVAHVPVRNDIAITDPLIQSFVAAFNSSATTTQFPEMNKYWTNFCDTQQIFEAGVDASEWVSGATAAANQ